MQTRRWVNQSQPQTLVIATWLLYLQAAFGLLFGIDPFYGLVFGGGTMLLVRLFLGAGGVAAGYGIANEEGWGYRLGLAVAALPLAVRIYICFRYQLNPLRFDLIPIMFDVALFALLLHPMSREYERVWFSKKPRGGRGR
jgi:uncharacterized membrane protein